MQCGPHSEMLAPWMFFSWVSNPSSLRGGALPLLIGRKLLWGFQPEFGFSGSFSSCLWHHHNFYNMTSHTGHGWGWWRKSSRSLALTITCLNSCKSQTPPRCVARVTWVWMSLHHRPPLAHGGAQAALLLLEGPDPCSCWGLLMWLRLTQGCVAGSSL